MGVPRASIDITFKAYGETYKREFWIDYSPDEDGVDPRIRDWFRASWEAARAAWAAEERAAEREERARHSAIWIAPDRAMEHVERKERAELARLREKYGYPRE